MSKQLVKLSQKILDPSLQEQFVQTVQSGMSSPHALVWMQEPLPLEWSTLEGPKFFPPWVQLISCDARPGRSPLHDEGRYYVMDPSSVLMMVGLLHLDHPVRSVLDMCAAPGGKSALAYRALQPEILVCNEVVWKRHRSLVSNLRRCKINAVVTQQESNNWSEAGFEFDLVIVDAPCSGQSLFARGEAEPGCFHPSTVNGCRLRQRRIVGESAKLITAGGSLIYSTCTYAPEENEDIVDWLLKKNPEIQAIPIPVLSAYRSKLSENPCYRFFPDPVLGSGGFCALFRKKGNHSSQTPSVPSDWIHWRPEL